MLTEPHVKSEDGCDALVILAELTDDDDSLSA